MTAIALWAYKGYISPSGRRDPWLWREGLSDAAQAALDVLMEHLAARSRTDWSDTDFKMLKGKHKKVGEFRFVAGKVEHRPLGFFGPGRMEYTLLIGATKKGKNYAPREALDSAVRRMDEVENGGAVHDWDD